MQQFVEVLYTSLNATFKNVDLNENNLCYAARLKADHAAENILILHTEFKTNLSPSLQEQVIYFKVLKPLIEKEFIYYSKVQNILENYPLGSAVTKKQYLKRQLDKLNIFFTENKQLFCYTRANNTHHDEFYFVEGHLNNSFMALYYAYNKLEVFINLEIDKLSPTYKPVPEIELNKSLSWTGSQAELVEIVYSLQSSGKINNGSASIKNLVSFFEKHFNTSLSDAPRTFQDLKNRMHPAKFLNSLAKILENRLLDS